MTSLGRHSYISRTGAHMRVYTLSYQFITHSYCDRARVCNAGHLRPPPLPRRRHWRFMRRAHDYLRAYSLFETPRSLEKTSTSDNVTLFALIEKTRRA